MQCLFHFRYQIHIYTTTQPICSAERAAIYSAFHRHTGEFCSLLPVTVSGHCTRTRETNTQTPPRRLSLMVLHQEQATCDSRYGCRYLRSCQSHGSITALICSCTCVQCLAMQTDAPHQMEGQQINKQ